jgi:hypothetical protein
MAVTPAGGVETGAGGTAAPAGAGSSRWLPIGLGVGGAALLAGAAIRTRRLRRTVLSTTRG